MEPTEEMIEAESRRKAALNSTHILLDCVARSTHIHCSPQDDPMLEEAIKLQMIGSHAGRIG